jgi:hypothetical protein
VNLRELIDQLLTINLTQGDMPVLSEEGQSLHSVEFNDDEEPCVLFLFGED